MAAKFIDQASIRAQSIYNGFAPTQLPKALYIPLDFTDAGSNGSDILIDLEQFEQEAHLEFIQNVYIDNTLSTKDLILTAQASQHSLTLAAGKQCFLPFFVPSKSKINASLSGVAAKIIKIQLLNMPVPAVVW